MTTNALTRPRITEELIINILQADNYIMRQLDDASMVTEIATCYLNDEPRDGYEFMKELENRFLWDGDITTAELLEEVIGKIEAGYQKHIQDWVNINNIEPKFNPGDHVPNTDMVVLDIDKYRPFTYQIQFKNTMPKVGGRSYIQRWFDQVEEQ